MLLTATACGASAATSSVPASSSPAADSRGVAAAADTSGRYADWASYGGGPYRHSYATTMPRATGTPKVYKRLALDGAVYAAPLIVKGITIVATEHNTVYAFSSTYRQLWKRHLGAPSPAGQRPCGNIDPLGITGTPVYSAKTKQIYVAPEFSGSPPRHMLYALSFASGRVAWRHHLDFPGVDQVAMQQRGALLTSGSRVYVPFGGLAGDCGGYKGRVVSYPINGSYRPQSYTVPTAREAGIWTPPGVVGDRFGNLFVAVGNGAAGPGDRYDHSDSVLKLTRSLRLTSFFSPTSWAADNAADYDLGSQAPAIVGRWIFTEGKSGSAYVLRRSNLGGIGGQVSSARVCNTKSYGGTAVVGSVVYVPCEDGVRAVRIDAAGRMHVLWHARSAYTGSPTVGGGRVWTLDTGNGVLHALAPSTGGSHAAVAVGPVSRFAALALYGRTIAVPTLSGLTVVHTAA